MSTGILRSDQRVVSGPRRLLAGADGCRSWRWPAISRVRRRCEHSIAPDRHASLATAAVRCGSRCFEMGHHNSSGGAGTAVHRWGWASGWRRVIRPTRQTGQRKGSARVTRRKNSSTESTTLVGGDARLGSSARQSASRAAMCREASKPKCRIRTKRRGTTCWRNRRTNSSSRRLISLVRLSSE